VETPAVGGDLVAIEEGMFKEHCEEEFAFLAKRHPTRLLSLIGGELQTRPELLTFAAEAAGRISSTSAVIASLLPLLTHPDPVVREGAIYGLQPHLEGSIEARAALRELAVADLSPGVRDAARDALADID
jgi:HEAT repeat protein